MMKWRNFVLLAAAFLTVAGCGSKEEDSAPKKVPEEVQKTTEDSETVTAAADPTLGLDITDMFSSRDYEASYNEAESTLIQLNGDSATCSAESVEISGSTLTITEEGTYVVCGSLDNGSIVIDAGDSDKVQLVLKDASIHNENFAPIYILGGDKVFLTLADGTTNSLSNGGTFTSVDDDQVDGVIFSKQDLTLNGSGSLTVDSPAGHGIVCKDDLVFTSGIYTITAASHGLDANDSIRMVNASLTIDSGKDGIHAENEEDTSLGFIYVDGGTFQLTTEGEGIKASGNMVVNSGTFQIDSTEDALHANASMAVNGGELEVASGDDAFHADETLLVTSGKIHITESYEGLEALHVKISGGDITLASDDDGINAAGGKDESGFQAPHGGPGKDRFGGGKSSSDGSIMISGGNLNITAYGDGIDANGTLTISEGNIVVSGPDYGDTATLDYDVSGVINGGTFIGTGAYQMAQTFSDSGQGVVALSVENQSEGTEITLTDKNGNVLLSHTPELPFAVVILSNPDIVKGEKYTVTIGEFSEEMQAY